MAVGKSDKKIERCKARHRAGYSLMEVLIALSLMGMVFFLSAAHIGTLTSGWFLMRDVRSDLITAREIEAVLTGFADRAEGSVVAQDNGAQVSLSTQGQSLLLDQATHRLVWDWQSPFPISLPEPETRWRLDYDETSSLIMLLDGEQLIASARLENRIALPCVYDAIGRRCLGSDHP